MPLSCQAAFLLVLLSAVVPLVTAALSTAPNATRLGVSYDWCDCAKGMASVEVWPLGDEASKVTVAANDTRWIDFATPVSRVQWRCDGMAAASTSSRSAHVSMPPHGPP